MSDRDHFTVVFAGDLRKLKSPFKINSEFGEPVSIAYGHALDELDEYRDEANNHDALVAELKRLFELYGHQATADVLALVQGDATNG